MDISFILTSNRDSSFIHDEINRLNSLSEGMDNELLVSFTDYIDFVPKEARENLSVTAFRNKGAIGEGLGVFPETSVTCYNYLASKAKGSWIVLLVDDHELVGNLQDFYKFVTEDKDFLARKYHIGTLKGTGNPIAPGSSSSICRWPVLSKETCNKLEVLFNQNFYHHWCDNWISFWLEKVGGEGIHTFNQLSMNTKAHTTYSGHDEYDAEIYSKLCAECEEGNTEYNLLLP